VGSTPVHLLRHSAARLLEGFMVDQPTILVERRGRVALVTLNRPEKLNALSSQLALELTTAIEALDADNEIGAIVLTGAGERAFSSGGDLEEQRQALKTGTLASRMSSTATVLQCRKPTLAAIRGYAYGGGAVLALSCDIRIAGDDARFKFPGATYGQPTGGAILPRIVGAAKAKELLFTGDDVDAAEAWRIGLVNQVVPIDQVLETALAMAERIAANSPATLQVLKQAVERALPIDEARALESGERGRQVRNSAETAIRMRAAADRVVGPEA
jgi:enoyl-CoA hydratase/carnithine racemase